MTSEPLLWCPRTYQSSLGPIYEGSVVALQGSEMTLVCAGYGPKDGNVWRLGRTRLVRDLDPESLRPWKEALSSPPSPGMSYVEVTRHAAWFKRPIAWIEGARRHAVLFEGEMILRLERGRVLDWVPFEVLAAKFLREEILRFSSDEVFLSLGLVELLPAIEGFEAHSFGDSVGSLGRTRLRPSKLLPGTVLRFRSNGKPDQLTNLAYQYAQTTRYERIVERELSPF